MRVALISNEGGGISSVTRGLASALSKKKVFTTIITEGDAASYKKEIETVNDYLEIIRLPVIYFPPRGLWFQLRHFHFLSNLLKQHSITHGISPQASVCLSFYKKKLNKPFITTIHSAYNFARREFLHTPVSHWTLSDFGLHVIEHPWHHFMISSCLANSDHIVACSMNTLNELRATYKNVPMKRISAISNGIDFDEIESIRIEDDVDSDKNNLSIVFAGRFFYLKGVLHLLRAMKTLSLNFKNVRLKIFGAGPLETRVKEFISKEGLRDTVLFRGRISHRQLIAEIKSSDFVVHPSLHEAQSMLALEAMACMKPVVAFNAPFVHETIKNGYNGILAKPFDTVDLSEKIRILLEDTKLCRKLGRNAYSYVKLNHNWDLQTVQYLKIYENFAN